ncbi:MAG: twin-arginine translocation signal domain-containing protein [Candidatus Sulfotelmatobacter sp.]
MSPMRSTSRRDFLKKCLTGAAALHASGRVGLLAAAEQEAALAKSRVVMAHDAMLRGAGASVDSRRMLSLLDRAMQGLFDRDNPIETWKKLVRPGERVGLKVNALGGRGLSSNLELVEAVCERLQEAGIKASDIVVWDRDSGELEHVGFHVSTGGNHVQCFGTDRVDY